MEEILQLKEFFIEGGSKKQSHVVLQISEPTTPEEKEKGYFFIIGEINNADQDYLTKFYEIIDTAQKNYYQDHQLKNNDALESVLSLINHQAHYLTKPPTSLHCVIGVAHQGDVVFSFYGEPHIVLFYKTANNSYERMDLVKNNATPSDEPAAKVLFSQLIQGKITSNDFLFFSTPHVVSQINLDRLQKVITTRTPEQSCQHLENILRQLGSNYSYAGLIMYQEKLSTPSSFPIAARGNLENSTKSLHHFFNTEQKTVQTLSSSKGRVVMRANVRSGPLPVPTSPLKNSSREPTLSSSPTHYPSSHTFSKTTFSWPKIINFLYYGGKLLLSLLIILWTFLINILKQFLLIFYVITNYKNKRKNTLENWHRQLYSYKQNIKQLPFLTKIMLVGCIVLMSIFIGSVIYIKTDQQKTQKLKAYQTQIELIKTKKDNAESALIYKDESTARNEIQEAQVILNGLSCQTKEEKNTCEQLQKNIEELSTKLRKVLVVKPETLTTWKQTPDLKGLVKMHNTLISFSPLTNSLLTYDLLSKETTVQTTTNTASGFSAATVPKENDYVLLVINKNELLQFKPDNTFRKVPISYMGVGDKISDLVVYNQRLYRLDAENNQVYRHNFVNNSFGSGKGWVQDSQVDLKNATSLTIDGDIFILKNSGEIIKLSKGVKQNFSIKGLDPELKNGGKIWTYNDLKYIYILDSTDKRLIIIDKEGNLKSQIKATEFEHPNDMVIDEENKIGFILDTSTVYKINLPI